MLHRLFYISKANRDIGKKDYEQILAASRRNNRLINVTGLLVVKGNYFAQALEGRKERVTALYDKIMLDKRHSGVVRLCCEDAVQRIFPAWDMGFRDINSTGLGLAKVDFSDPKFIKDPEELSLVFKKFVE